MTFKICQIRLTKVCHISKYECVQPEYDSPKVKYAHICFQQLQTCSLDAEILLFSQTDKLPIFAVVFKTSELFIVQEGNFCKNKHKQMLRLKKLDHVLNTVTIRKPDKMHVRFSNAFVPFRFRMVH